MSSQWVKDELEETLGMLLAAMQAEASLVHVSPQTSLQEANRVLQDANIKADAALDRFETMCARIACGLKNM